VAAERRWLCLGGEPAPVVLVAAVAAWLEIPVIVALRGDRVAAPTPGLPDRIWSRLPGEARSWIRDRCRPLACLDRSRPVPEWIDAAGYAIPLTGGVARAPVRDRGGRWWFRSPGDPRRFLARLPAVRVESTARSFQVRRYENRRIGRKIWLTPPPAGEAGMPPFLTIDRVPPGSGKQAMIPAGVRSFGVRIHRYENTLRRGRAWWYDVLGENHGKMT